MKKKKLIIILVLFLALTTGCTKYLSDNDKKRITNEKTGQSLTSNILCKPTDKELISIYEKYEDKMIADTYYQIGVEYFNKNKDNPDVPFVGLITAIKAAEQRKAEFLLQMFSATAATTVNIL